MGDYNGWTNRATWLVNLWVMNDYGTYMLFKFSPFTDADDCREFVTEKISPVIRQSIIRDMGNSLSFDDVDWNEILEA